MTTVIPFVESLQQAIEIAKGNLSTIVAFPWENNNKGIVDAVTSGKLEGIYLLPQAASVKATKQIATTPEIYHGVMYPLAFMATNGQHVLDELKHTAITVYIIVPQDRGVDEVDDIVSELETKLPVVLIHQTLTPNRMELTKLVDMGTELFPHHTALLTASQKTTSVAASVLYKPLAIIVPFLPHNEKFLPTLKRAVKEVKENMG